MKPNLVLHIGTEKTGTTSIQAFLVANRTALLKSGVYSPLSIAWKGNSRSLVAAIQDIDKWGDDFFEEHSIDTPEKRSEFSLSLLSKFRNELSELDASMHTVVISCEHFHSRISHHTELTRLKALFDEVFEKVTIVCYLREQAAFSESAYSAAIKAGYKEGLEAIDPHVMVKNSYYNYQLLLEPWIQIFGIDSLNVREFSKSRFRSQGLLQDFAGIFSRECSNELNFSIPKENESLSIIGQQLGRILNARIPRYKNGGGIDPLHHEVMTFLTTNFSGNGQRLCDEERNGINQAFAPSNKWVSDNFWNGRDGYFIERAGTITDTNPDSEHISLVFTAMLDLLVQSRKTNLNPEDIDVIRDIAIEIEPYKLSASESLMAIAHNARPYGTVILEKLIHYRSLLEQEK